MSASTGSTMVRRQLGRKLKRLREEAGKTLADVELAQIASATKMWRIETGRTATKPGDVWELTRFYGASTDVTEALSTLAKATRSEGWLEEYSGSRPGLARSVRRPRGGSLRDSDVPP